MKALLWTSISALLFGAAVVGALLLFRSRTPAEAETTEYRLPEQRPEDVLVDDRLDDKNPVFDPTLVDSRPWGEYRLNASAAVIRLDVPFIKPDQEPDLLTLHPSYAQAAASLRSSTPLLPSVNLIDGKAKQFDDGLYAALDQAYYKGLHGRLTSHVALIERWYERAGRDNPAAAFLAAGLELAGVHVAPTDRASMDRFLAEFQANEVRSKPIGFYTWNDDLQACFRFLRFFQCEFERDELSVPAALAQVLSRDPELLAEYRQALDFYARLTNPYLCLSVADLIGKVPLPPERFVQLCNEKHVDHASVALFPPSTSKETVLFEKLFPGRLPANGDLMRELIRRIRSGEVNLQPGPNSGWYEYQVYALETLLLPEKAPEHPKLFLTASYKKRMLEAFQALITKRRETHARQVAPAGSRGIHRMPPQQPKFAPRLRLEPCPSYYLRTARAYSFLANFLEAAISKQALQQLHGLKEGGERSENLYAELQFMRSLFYGCYLLSAEDIGLKPSLASDEVMDRAQCSQLASEWLGKAFQDPDLAVDTRVSVPIYADPVTTMQTKLWATLGVRLARLQASYARPPSIHKQGESKWQPVSPSLLKQADYIIPVDEFAEITLSGIRVLNRQELRKVCDREKTKDKIMAALQK